MVWAPRVTVAAVIERDGQFLIVEEHTGDGLKLSQPAGHLEPGESLEHAVCRETLEETACVLTPTGLIGTYLWRPDFDQAPTFLRFTFAGTVADPVPGLKLDPDIKRAFWISAAELRSCQAEHRSPLVMQSVDDYLRVQATQQLVPLSALNTHPGIVDKQYGKQ